MFPVSCSCWPGRLCRTRLGPAPQVEQPAAVIKAAVFGHGPVPVGVSNKCCFDRNVWEQNRLCPQTEPLNPPALPPPPLPQLTSCGSTELAGPKVQEPERIGTRTKALYVSITGEAEQFWFWFCNIFRSSSPGSFWICSEPNYYFWF